MKRCIIVGAGDFFGFQHIPREGDFIIAADAGYQELKDMGIKPDLIVGDFDSMDVAIPYRQIIEHPDSEIDIYQDAERGEYIHKMGQYQIDGVKALSTDSVMKNDSDIMACVRIAIEEGYEEFLIYGGTGGNRIDHTLANLQVLAYLARHGLRGWLYGREKSVITAITNSKIEFDEEQRGFLSVFSYSDQAEGVTETGLKYKLDNVTLSNSIATGLSNEFVGKKSTISVKEGTLLIIYYE